MKDLPLRVGKHLFLALTILLLRFQETHAQDSDRLLCKFLPQLCYKDDHLSTPAPTQRKGKRTSSPTLHPSVIPSKMPTTAPSFTPSVPPSTIPSTAPTAAPTTTPSSTPSTKPSNAPSKSPTSVPSMKHSSFPTLDAR